MVIFGGVGEAMILKWVGAKLTGAMAGHLATASAHTVTNFAMHSAINSMAVASSATATGGMLGGAMAIRESAKAHARLAKQVLKHQAKGTAMSLTDIDSLNDEDAAKIFLLIMVLLLCEAYYNEMEHSSKDYNVKTTLLEMEPCSFSVCDCPDLNNSGGKCTSCAHDSDSHGSVSGSDVVDGSAVEWLAQAMAAEVYQSLQNRDGEGNLKTALNQIDTCKFQSCPCYDFNLSEEMQVFSRRCSCGHRWREHVITGQWTWIIETLAVCIASKIMEEEA